MSSSTTGRYAIYLAPPEASPLEEFARRWLGRDHTTGKTVAQLQADGIAPERLRKITASPRHYGFHGTLKAPFVLNAGCSGDDLIRAAHAFATTRQSFEICLEPQALNGFLALVPKAPCPALDLLAAACVRNFEPFRAPLSDFDIARRRRSNLTARQDAQLLAFGYPYIFDDFHFHMTLTERLDRLQQETVLSVLLDLTGHILSAPIPFMEIAIYAQSTRNEPFTLRQRLPFGR